MFAFGALGFIAIALIAIFVRPWLSEVTVSASTEGAHVGQGFETLLNRHTILLSALSLIGGLIIYGYLGMYPSFLRTHLGYSPQAAGNVMAFFGFGVLASVAGGAIGDRLPARVLLPSRISWRWRDRLWPFPRAFKFRAYRPGCLFSGG